MKAMKEEIGPHPRDRSMQGASRALSFCSQNSAVQPPPVGGEIEWERVSSLQGDTLAALPPKPQQIVGIRDMPASRKCVSYLQFIFFLGLVLSGFSVNT